MRVKNPATLNQNEIHMEKLNFLELNRAQLAVPMIWTALLLASAGGKGIHIRFGSHKCV